MKLKGSLYHHLALCDIFVERATIMSHEGISLNVLHVGPGAFKRFITFLIVYCHLQYKQKATFVTWSCEANVGKK